MSTASKQSGPHSSSPPVHSFCTVDKHGSGLAVGAAVEGPAVGSAEG